MMVASKSLKCVYSMCILDREYYVAWILLIYGELVFDQVIKNKLTSIRLALCTMYVGRKTVEPAAMGRYNITQAFDIYEYFRWKRKRWKTKPRLSERFELRPGISST